MPPIVRIHVASLAPQDDRPPGRSFALWPEPVDHDAGLAEAGFTAFADSDDEWDEQFEALVGAVFAQLAQLGELAIDAPDIAPARRSLWSRLRGDKAVLTPAERFILAVRDDQLGPVRAHFGPRATVTARDGHPILWIWLRDDVAATWPVLCQAVAAGRPIVETALDWARLAPG